MTGAMKDEIEPCKIDGLVEYFGRPRGYSSINKRSLEHGCEYDDWYVSR
jgi:hypothetical protein